MSNKHRNIQSNNNKSNKRTNNKTNKPGQNKGKKQRPLIIKGAQGDENFILTKEGWKFTLTETNTKVELFSGNQNQLKKHMNAFGEDFPDGFVKQINKRVFRYNDWFSLYPRTYVTGYV